MEFLHQNKIEEVTKSSPLFCGEAGGLGWERDLSESCRSLETACCGTGSLLDPRSWSAAP